MPKAPLEGVVENTVLASAPTIGAGQSIPAAALWWDGFTIAKNISDEDAAASFVRPWSTASAPKWSPPTRTSPPGSSPATSPGPAAVGVIANATGGARAYPMQPYMGLLHTALSAELAEFMAGSEDAAKQALADVKAAYDTAAKEGGFL